MPKTHRRPTTRDAIDNLTFRSGAAPAIGDLMKSDGFNDVGDGGSGTWEFKGLDGQTPSQSPGDLVDALFNDPSGFQWEVNTSTDLKIKSIGGDPLAVNNKAVFLAAEASNVIRVDLQGGSYTTTIVSSPNTPPLLKDYFNGEVFIVSTATSEPELWKQSIGVADYEIARPRTKSPVVAWAGLNVLWLGTSIPHQGAGFDSYPELFGKSLKCFVDNKAWSGSHAFWDFGADEFTLSTIQALSMTEDDRLHGLATFGGTSVYDDSFNPITLASQQTVDYRIRMPFLATPFDVVMLDHNHNDRSIAVGELSPTELTINSITIGATTDLVLADASSISVNDSITARVNGIPFLDFVSGTVTAKTSNTITLNLDSTSYVGTFTDGTVQLVDKTTFCGAWQFLIFYINNQAIINSVENVKIVLCGAPSEHTNNTVFENSIFRSGEVIKQIAEKYNLTFFDIGFEYDIKKIDQLVYFPDSVHPTTTETRISLANYWIKWASGGNLQPVNSDDFLPASNQDFQDQRASLFSDLRGGFNTPETICTDSGSIVDEDFSTGIGAWTPSGVTPITGAAPWGVGDAAFFAATVATNKSVLTQGIAGTDSWSVEFDLWMPEVAGLPNGDFAATTDLFRVRTTGAAYGLQLISTLQTTAIKMTYFKTANVDFVVLGTSKTKLTKEFKHKIRIDMEKATSGDNGFMAVYLDDVKVIEGNTEDSGQGTPANLDAGIQTTNTGNDLDLYLSNILFNGKSCEDFTQRFTGSFTAQSGETVTVVNGIIVTAV